MKRSLTAREWILLAVLAVLALASAYILLFYTPMTAARDAALADAELCRDQIEAAQLRLSEKRRMERELEALFAQDADPVSLAPYDNVQPVMVELNAVLSAAEDYALTFGSVDAGAALVRRTISLTFTSRDYDGAKAMLQQLHDSVYRCMVDGVAISIGQDGAVSVSAALVYFEYQS